MPRLLPLIEQSRELHVGSSLVQHGMPNDADSGGVDGMLRHVSASVTGADRAPGCCKHRGGFFMPRSLAILASHCQITMGRVMLPPE